MDVIEATSKLEFNKPLGYAIVSVWWDLENWDDYKDVDPLQIKGNICLALGRAGYKGSVYIFCYVEEFIIHPHVLKLLSSTGIHIKQYPRGMKHAMLMVDMVVWSNRNPPLANYLFISDDHTFAFVIDHLQNISKHHFLLAVPPYASSLIVPAPKAVWLWPILFSGGSPITKKDFLKLGGYCYDDDEIITGSDDDEIITGSDDDEIITEGIPILNRVSDSEVCSEFKV